MKNINKKELFTVTLSLFLICACTALLMASVENLTHERVTRNALQAAEETRSGVISADSFAEKTLDDRIYYEALDQNGKLIGYAVESASQGYGGEIKITVGFDLQGGILGVAVADAGEETPGLGSNIAKPAFLKQFEGQSGPLSLRNGGGTGEIDAVASATYSSTGVVDAVNQAMELCHKVIGEAQ